MTALPTYGRGPQEGGTSKAPMRQRIPPDTRQGRFFEHNNRGDGVTPQETAPRSATARLLVRYAVERIDIRHENAQTG
jgi:hypothetical protein